MCLPAVINLERLHIWRVQCLQRAMGTKDVLSAVYHFLFFFLDSLILYFCLVWKLPLTCTSTPTPAVLRRTEGEMGARSGRLHGNGLVWQYQEKAWYFSQIKKEWSGITTEHLQFNNLTTGLLRKYSKTSCIFPSYLFESLPPPAIPSPYSKDSAI